MSKFSYKPTVLPSDDAALKTYISKHSVELMEAVLDSIEYSLLQNSPSIEIFKFENSDFVITLNRNCYLDNVQNIYERYVELKKFELCGRVKRLNIKLLKTS